MDRSPNRGPALAWTAALLALILLVCAQAFVWRNGSFHAVRDGGDLEFGSSLSGTVPSQAPRDVGVGSHIRNPGDSPATLLAVSLDDGVPVSNARLREALVFDRADSGFGMGVGTWPDAEIAPFTEPLEGYVVEPGAEIGLVFVIDVRSPGPSIWETATLTYEQNGEVHHQTGAFQFALCRKAFSCARKAWD